MIYNLIISILTEKPFYLLRTQSFSFQIVSEFIDTFVKFSKFMSRGGAFDSLFCPEGRVFVHNDCPGGFCPLRVLSCGLSLGERFWMKLIAALMCTVAGPDHNPRGGGQLPNLNECNFTLMSATRGIYPYPYI